ncbi:MAG: glutaminyl-peptide cyclotransferase, partial [Nitrospinae bacterium]|nr:glutaminyl-peptide cyclotransferase [Nitrospinota bacterium]
DKTLIVLLSPSTLFPLYNQSLSLLERDRFNISIGYPLHRTPIFGFYSNLMNLINSMDNERFYVRDYLKFVLHPYIKNIYYNQRTDVTRIIFHTIEEILSLDRFKTFLSIKQIENDENILITIIDRLEKAGISTNKNDIIDHLKSIYENTINKFISFTDIGDLAHKAIEILQYINNNSTANLHYFFYPFSERFLNDLFILKNSLLAKETMTSVNSYFNLFKKYIKLCRIPFEGTPINGLQILGFLEARNIMFERIFILDANDDILPGNKKDEGSFLPFKLRKAIGVPTYHDLERRTSYYFDTLINGAAEVNIFYIENDKKEKSRLVEKLLWQIQKRDNNLDQTKYINSIQYNIEIKKRTPEAIVKTQQIMDVIENDIKYSASALDSYLTCQLKFYYGYILRLKRKDLILSDGTQIIYFLDSKTFKKKKTIEVSLNGNTIKNINELEYVNGVIYANIWHDNRIMAICPDTGKIFAVIDASNLYNMLKDHANADVLNGIAYNYDNDTFYLTGKNWDTIFQVRFIAVFKTY